MKIIKKTETVKIKIKDLFKIFDIKEKEGEIFNINFPFFIKTPYGFNQIENLHRTSKCDSYTSYFGNNSTLKTSNEHLLKVNGQWEKIKNIKSKDVIETECGETYLKECKKIKNEILYDLSVKDVHCFYANGILCHNSWILTKISTEALKEGKNVVYFTLELNENYVGLRHDSCFTQIPFQDIRKEKQIVQEKLNEVNGKLKIKYYPVKTISANTIKNCVERIEMTGTKIDLIIVDYADLLKSIANDKNSNSYSDGGNIYEELRSIAGELQIPCWTVSQTNRGGEEKDIVQGNDIADSYKKIMTADFVMSLSRKIEDKENDTARFHIIKNRFGPDGMTFPAFMDTSCGDIKIFEEDSKEGIETQSKMNDGENTIKKLLHRKYNEVADSNL